MVLSHGGHRKEICGAVAATTNNRMELTAAIAGLMALRQPCEVELYTDSNYVKDGMQKWLAGWKAKGWRTSTKQPVKNEDLWRALDEAATKHEVTWRWLKGHAGHPENERCDELATGAIAKLRGEHSAAQLKAALATFTQGSAAPSLPL